MMDVAFRRRMISPFSFAFVSEAVELLLETSDEVAFSESLDVEFVASSATATSSTGIGCRNGGIDGVSRNVVCHRRLLLKLVLWMSDEDKSFCCTFRFHILIVNALICY